MLIDAYRFGPSAPALWTPAMMSAPPKIMLTPQSDVTDVSGKASQWNDVSGNAWHFTQQDPDDRPTINSSGFNGKRSLAFGSPTRLRTIENLAYGLYRNVPNGWALVAFKRAATGTATRVLFGASHGNSPGAARFRVDIASDVLRLAAQRTDAAAAVTLSAATSIDTNWHVVLMTADYAGREAVIWLDGQVDGSSTTFGTAGNTSNTASNAPINIGSNMNGTEAYFDGKQAWVLAGADGLPARSEIDRLFGAVHHDGGIASQLPIDHPFRHVPPYVNTPVLQPSFASDPVVIGFVAATNSGDVGVADGPAVATEFGALLNSEPALSGGQGITVTSDGSNIDIRLDGLTPPATPAQAVVLDHKGGTIGTYALTDAGGYYTGSGVGVLEDDGVYYVRIEEI